MSATTAAHLLATQDMAIERQRRRLVSDANVTVCAGDAIHLRGANGSGKTTSLRVLAGLTRPAGGRVRRRGPCAFVPEKVSLTPAVRCGEWLEAMRRLRGAPPVGWSAALAASGLEETIVDRRSGALSKGMLQRVALVEAFSNGASLVLLDEPFSGLDADGRRWLAGLIEDHGAGGRACVFTDHSEASRAEMRPTNAWQLAGGELTVAEIGEPALTDVRVVAVIRDGERATHRVPAVDLGATLVALISEGWAVDEVVRP